MEIHKLERMLKNGNISYSIQQMQGGFQIYNVDECPDFDVIEHNGSYGHEVDLLEIMGLLTDEEAEIDGVKGYLTAENVFERICLQRASN